MIDLITNAFFGKEDGQNFSDNINLLKDAYANGITHCILAPPCFLHQKGDTDRFLNQRAKLVEKIENLSDEQLPKVIFGAKVFMDHDISLHKEIEKLCIANGKYLLVELPSFAKVSDYDEWIYNLNVKGIIPIIAHLETYPFWKDLIVGLSGVKACYQVSTSAINRFFKRRVVKKLISCGKKFFISSQTLGNTPCVVSPQKVLEKAKRHFPKNFSSFFLTDFNFFI